MLVFNSSIEKQKIRLKKFHKIFMVVGGKKKPTPHFFNQLTLTVIKNMNCKLSEVFKNSNISSAYSFLSNLYRKKSNIYRFFLENTYFSQHFFIM